jgi:hypothetical protein
MRLEERCPVEASIGGGSTTHNILALAAPVGNLALSIIEDSASVALSELVGLLKW